MLKGSNIYGKLEFGFSVLGALLVLLLIGYIEYYESFMRERESYFSARAIVMLVGLFGSPYLPLTIMTFYHARSSWVAGVLAIVTSLLYGIISFLVASSLHFASPFLLLFFGIPFTIFAFAAINQTKISEARREHAAERSSVRSGNATDSTNK